MLSKRTFTGITRSLMHGGVGYPLIRSVANAGDKNCRSQTAGPTNVRRADEYSGAMKDLKRITAGYKTMDFKTTLAEAPVQVMWTVIATVTPLVVRPLYTEMADYPVFAVGYVSLYVIAANVWLLASRDDRDGLFSSSTSLSTFHYRAIFPMLECVTAIAALPPIFGLLVVEHATFRTVVLLIDGPAAENSWRRSTVLLVFGISTSSLTIALIMTLIEHN